MQQKPLFNKRLYKANAGIKISTKASDILQRGTKQQRSEADIREIRSVIAGLREIHKNLEVAKTALGHAVTYEKHDSDVRIEKKRTEDQMSCYYILSGSVEAFYTVKNNRTPLYPKKEQSISYTNVAGDYVGLLSADGPKFDLPPPECMNTIGHCELLRIDAAVFHEKIQEAQKLIQDEIVRFLDDNDIFEKITEEDRWKLVTQMVKQLYPARKQILSQGKKQEHAFFIAEGRCIYHRRLHLTGQNRSELFKMGHIEKGSYFDATCILDDQNSKFSVSAVGPVTCYLLNKWTIKSSESLLRALRTNRLSFPTDKEIELLAEESDKWQSYKRETVCEAITLKHKDSSRIVPQSIIPRPLDIAIKQGCFLRQQKQRHQITTPTDDLNPSGRFFRQSFFLQDETTDEANTVLKAVVPMKRSRSARQINKKVLSTSNPEKIKENNLSLHRPAKSAPNTKRQESQDKPSKNTQLKSNKQKQQNMKINNKRSRISVRAKSPQLSPLKREIPEWNAKEPKAKPSKTPSFSTFGETPLKTEPEKNNWTAKQYFHSSPLTPFTRENEKKHGKSEFNDCWMASDKKFRVKEIVNTRIPGNEKPVEVYQRFEPSMFTYVDVMNNFEKDTAVNAFESKMRAQAWLRQAKERLATGGSDYNPGQSPIIVIEEFCPEDEGKWDKRNGHESSCDRNMINPGSLETLHEDSDKENLAENENLKNEWTTPLHYTRDEARYSIDKAKSEIATLERQLIALGWTRDMLNAKERQINERKTKRVRSCNKKIEEVETEQDKQKELVEKQSTDRIQKILKRPDSIQKILENHSKRFYRRNRSHSDEKHDKRTKPVMKRYSTDATGSSRMIKQRIIRTRTFTIA